MDQKERLNLMLGMRTQTDFCNIFNDNYTYDKYHPDKIYICWVCNRWFTLKQTLKVHFKTNYHHRHLIKNEFGETINHPFLCPCGGKYIKKHKARHEKSIMHKRYIQNKK